MIVPLRFFAIIALRSMSGLSEKPLDTLASSLAASFIALAQELYIPAL